MPLSDTIKSQILARISEYGTGADTLRCLAFATIDKPLNPKPEDLRDAGNFVNYEQNMTFIGAVGIVDPPRDTVAHAIKLCEHAGIRVIVITGDNKDTAEAICRKIGIFQEGESTKGISFSGRDFDEMSIEEQKEVSWNVN